MSINTDFKAYIAEKGLTLTDTNLCDFFERYSFSDEDKKVAEHEAFVNHFRSDMFEYWSEMLSDTPEEEEQLKIANAFLKYSHIDYEATHCGPCLDDSDDYVWTFAELNT